MCKTSNVPSVDSVLEFDSKISTRAKKGIGLIDREKKRYCQRGHVSFKGAHYFFGVHSSMKCPFSQCLRPPF